MRDLDPTIAERDVLVVEDVVDTGLTLNYLIGSLRAAPSRDVAVCALLDRPYRRLVDDLPRSLRRVHRPDEFYVGYGFDLGERYRGLPDIRTVTKR